jgi:hypothetical protein
MGGGVAVCQACMKKLDEKFADVKKYIYDNPGANAQQVADDNDVSLGQIRKWVREERLSFSEDSPVGLECESCGKMIKTGRFCSSCKDKMANNLSSAYKEPEKIVEKKSTSDGRGPRMRFFDN